MHHQNRCHEPFPLRDFGGHPLVIDMDRAAKCNSCYRFALWTGEYFQVTLMNIPAGGDVGLEMHSDTDQFLRIGSGCGLCVMGESPEKMTVRKRVGEKDAVIVPAGTWHNLINTGSTALKLYSVYAPPHHPFGTIQPRKEDAED